MKIEFTSLFTTSFLGKLKCPTKYFSAVTVMYYQMEDIRILEVIRWSITKIRLRNTSLDKQNVDVEEDQFSIQLAIASKNKILSSFETAASLRIRGKYLLTVAKHPAVIDCRHNKSTKVILLISI